jgi:ATP-dependent exoDNAse (exonuclease V) alpha subunit
MHKGPVGTLQLNQMLQTTLNEQPVGSKDFAGRFHINDKVMHLRNSAHLSEVW